MKKIITALVTCLSILTLAVPEQKADAQVLYSNRCCDSYLVVRCIINPPAPVGSGCFCYYQGNGMVC